MQQLYKVCFSIWACCSILFSQAQDKVLFTVGDSPVYVSEFEYIYNKNNFNNKADYSRSSLQEYLDLYSRFRLKVKEAEMRGTDTLIGIKSEIESYRQQLFEAYIDREVTQKMVKAIYDRMQTDVSISQIFFNVGPGQDPAAAKHKADSVYQLLLNGASYEEMAKKYSDDPYTKDNGGKLGFYTAMQINFKSLEDAAYSTPKGSFTAPVKTALGYHIIKVNDIRPSLGKVKVLMIKKLIPEEPFLQAATMQTVDSIYQAILGGADFGNLAEQYSEDFTTGMRGGEMDWFGINTYNQAFEEAAFALKNPGDISPPVRTSKAWYIIKLINKSGIGSFEDISPALTSKLTTHPQYKEVMGHLLDSLKQQYGFTRYEDVYTTMLSSLGAAMDTFSNFYTPAGKPRTVLKIGSYSIDDQTLGNMMIRNSYMNKRLENKQYWMNSLYEKSEQEVLLGYHRDQMLQKDTDFRYLMKEYRDGILLFDITEKEVWDKAMADTAGLEAYFNAHKEKFRQSERLAFTAYKVPTEKEAKLIRATLLKSTPPVTLDDLSQEGMENIILTDSFALEKGKSLPNGVNWAKGVYGPIKEGDSYVVYHGTNILPERERTLDEARGFVIAAYQEELEKQWVAALRQKYPIVVNEPVFNSLVK